MAQNGIVMALFSDFEDHRDPSVRYFSGHPSDALLAVFISGAAALCPWDENLAKIMADVDAIIPFTSFDRHPMTAAKGLARHFGVPSGCRIEIPASTSYPNFLRYVDSLSDFDVLCRDHGIADVVNGMRAIKDEYELSCLRKAAAVTDMLIDTIEKRITAGSIKTELDAALLIEKESRAAGCEGTGFETLAAGPDRSFAIHCFPAYTAGVFGTAGLSILDFGVKWKGYTSDVTLTITRGQLSDEQEKQLALVELAYKAAAELYKPGESIAGAAKKADTIFSKAKRSMPHALGHGIGLEAHETPSVRSRGDKTAVFAPGMVVTLEPGLYSPVIGGCRLENDILITETGNETLTSSRIIRL
jgi:Xaa-Pro dipeptidase